MAKEQPYISLLQRNLLVSAVVVALSIIGVIGYSMIAGSRAEWDLVIAVGIGMSIASVALAIYDSRRGGRT